MKNEKLTTDQAFEWLLDNTKLWRKNTDLSPNHVTVLRNRYRKGELKESAKINMIEKSGLFDRTNYFQFKNENN